VLVRTRTSTVLRAFRQRARRGHRHELAELDERVVGRIGPRKLLQHQLDDMAGDRPGRDRDRARRPVRERHRDDLSHQEVVFGAIFGRAVFRTPFVSPLIEKCYSDAFTLFSRRRDIQGRPAGGISLFLEFVVLVDGRGLLEDFVGILGAALGAGAWLSVLGKVLGSCERAKHLVKDAEDKARVERLAKV